MGDYCALADFVMAVYNEVMFHDICHFQHSNTTGPNFRILFSDVQQKALLNNIFMYGVSNSTKHIIEFYIQLT